MLHPCAQDNYNKIDEKCLINTDQQTKIIESEIMRKTSLKIDMIILELPLIQKISPIIKNTINNVAKNMVNPFFTVQKNIFDKKEV